MYKIVIYSNNERLGSLRSLTEEQAKSFINRHLDADIFRIKSGIYNIQDAEVFEIYCNEKKIGIFCVDGKRGLPHWD